MLRITTLANSGNTSFIVEGKLAGLSVHELEKCWLGVALSKQNSHSILVDLSSVSFIDRLGQELLARMYQDGILLLGSGLLTKSIIEEIENRRRARTSSLPRNAN